MSRHDHERDRSDQTASEPTPPGPQQIAERAYHLWQARGRPWSDGLEDWFEAERQLLPPGSAAADRPTPTRGGQPHPDRATIAEQAREAHESDQARHATPPAREHMVDIGRGNQQAGRQVGKDRPEKHK
jgi:hypothetical protein